VLANIDGVFSTAWWQRQPLERAQQQQPLLRTWRYSTDRVHDAVVDYYSYNAVAVDALSPCAQKAIVATTLAKDNSASAGLVTNSN
jgi:hypothetical protein